MASITVREILGTTRRNIWNLAEGKHDVLYDDGTVVATGHKHIIFDRYIWELFLLCPQVSVLPEHSLASFVKNSHYNADTHMRMVESIFKYIVKATGITRYADKEPYMKTIYQIVNYIQNEILGNASAYVFTINAKDFVNVVNDKEVVAIANNLQHTSESIEKAYKSIKSYVSGDSSTNRFVQAYQAKAINENQANQCIGPRGLVSDMDRTVYRRPVTSGFIKGMSSLYEMMVESCTAAKALNATGSHIQTSEYTSRRIQVLTMVVDKIVVGDCGSTEYFRIIVTEQNIESLRGKHYLKPDNTLGTIQGDEKDLIDKQVQLRTALGCRHHDATKVCTTCLGEMSGNFEESSNLGYTATAYLMEKITQAILSTKHLTHSVRKSFIKLEGLASRYFYANENGDLFFHPDIDLTGLQLILPNARVGKLVDVLNLSHSNIGLAKIGELEEVVIRDIKPKNPVSEKLLVSYKDRPSVLTRHLVDYIRTCDLESDPRGNFVIPLDKIDKRNPVFNSPLKETNIIAFVGRISSIIELNKDKITDPYEKLELLLNTTLEKFRCNLFILEILVYATTVFNPMNGNYKLGRNSTIRQTEGKFPIFQNRDFSALGAFEEQMVAIKDNPTAVFSSLNKQKHPMAILFVPQHIVKN